MENVTTANSSIRQYINQYTARRSDLVLMDYANLATYYLLYIEMALCFGLNMVSIAFIIGSRLFTPINILILNLAMVDMLYSSCIPFFVVQFTGQDVKLSLFGCRMSYFLDVTCMIVISFTIAGLTLERYLCIKQKHMDTNDRSKLIQVVIYLLIVWTCASAYSLPKTLSIKYTEQELCESTLSPTIEKAYTIVKWLLAFALPYSVIVLVSALLLKFLKEWSARASAMKSGSNIPKELTTINQDETSPMRKASELEEPNKKTLVRRKSTSKSHHMRIKKRSTRFVLFVVFSYLCAWLPLWSFHIVLLFIEEHSVTLALVNNATLVSVYMQGVVDPLLYLFLTENFRKAWQKQQEWWRGGVRSVLRK